MGLGVGQGWWHIGGITHGRNSPLRTPMRTPVGTLELFLGKMWH